MPQEQDSDVEIIRIVIPSGQIYQLPRRIHALGHFYDSVEVEMLVEWMDPDVTPSWVPLRIMMRNFPEVVRAFYDRIRQ